MQQFALICWGDPGSSSLLKQPRQLRGAGTRAGSSWNWATRAGLIGLPIEHIARKFNAGSALVPATGPTERALPKVPPCFGRSSALQLRLFPQAAWAFKLIVIAFSFWVSNLAQGALISMDGAEHHYDAASINQEKLNRILTAALRRAQEGYLSEAIEELHDVVESHPDSSSAYELLGMLTAIAGDRQRGIAFLRQAIVLNPLQATAFTKLGDLLQAEGRESEATQSFLSAIATPTGDRRAYQRLGLIAEAEGDLETAVAHFERGIAGTPPTYLGIKLNLARLYNQQARFSATRELLGNSELGENVSAFVLLATAQLNDGEAELALDTLAKAREIDGSNAGVWLATGIAHRVRGHLAESVAALQRSLEFKPDWGVAQFQLGESYTVLTEYESAMLAYKAASSSPALAKAAELRIAQTLDDLRAR